MKPADWWRVAHVAQLATFEDKYLDQETYVLFMEFQLQRLFLTICHGCTTALILEPSFSLMPAYVFGEHCEYGRMFVLELSAKDLAAVSCATHYGCGWS